MADKQLKIIDNETGELITNGLQFTKTGLTIDPTTSYDGWESIGEQLNQIEGAIQWWIGDWLNFGEHRYGELYAQAIDAGADPKLWMDYKWVSNAIKTSFRNDVLSWSHHRVVAALSPDEQIYWLNEAVENQYSVSQLRQAIKDSEHEDNETPQLPDGKYFVIYADPPWPVGSIVMDKWESPIEDKYPTMTIEEIKALPVGNLAHDKCSLFLWTTHTFLPDALDIINEWGFKYSCCITWDKGGGWTQFGFHKRTEFLLYAYKGGINVDQYGDAIPTLISEKKTIHSKKPESIRIMIQNKTPEPRLEMFARDEFDGWVVWGNEVNNE